MMLQLMLFVNYRKKVKLLLPRLVKRTCTEITYFCDEFLWTVYFQIKHAKKYLKKKFKIASVSMFHCMCFLVGTLPFYNKSFAM